ncbi:MAG: bifunctional ornithine acetyltransferase/N-acetylglutamate synthase [Sutterellaceae bacterium]|nr:bifunctional ornithine acetyltransferase/N-acetylglutamate synthase [Sutterellaceae bacterium]
MKIIAGNVCAPLGFRANGVHCGIRRNKSKRDLSLIVSDVPCSAAAVYTQNLVKGAPLLVTQRHIADGRAQAVIVNSGIANTCNADGVEVAEKMAELAADQLGFKPEDICVASTGVIGQPLDLTPVREGLPGLVAGLARDTEHGEFAAQGIMTTDTRMKEIAVEFTAGGKTCRLGGIAKGSGMIHPNLATMLVFITTDCAVSPEMLKKALSSDVTRTFNMTSVDGDTSTNDNVVLLANGLAGNEEITSEGPDFTSFMQALNTITVHLCRMIAGDGEGATKMLECTVSNAKTEKDARTVAKAVITSSLVKTAMFGSDANWGRVLCATGYSGADVDVTKVELSFRSKAGVIDVCRDGSGIPFSEEIAKKVLSEKEIEILIDLHDGEGKATAWGCDLTYDYVKINGDYRT